MKIIHSVASITSIGGVADVVINLQRQLCSEGVQAEIVESGKDVNFWAGTLRAAFSDHIHRVRPDIIHDHGIWLPENHVAVTLAKAHSIPCVISTHGMLEPWAIKYKAYRKRLAWMLYQGNDLRSASVLHATTKMELKSLRALDLRQPIAVIPLGVNVPAPQIDACDREDEKKTVLFLARIHPKKGLLNLIEAWAILKPIGWRMVIAGPDENGHLAEVQRAIKRLGIEKDVSYFGTVSGQEKWDLYRLADLFVLPTLSENFGLVVAEALGCEVPVITTKGAPWEELVAENCGWWIDIGIEPLQLALSEAMRISDIDRRAMGIRGRLFVQERFSWPNIAARMLEVYKWLAEAGAKPNCIFD